MRVSRHGGESIPPRSFRAEQDFHDYCREAGAIMCCGECREEILVGNEYQCEPDEIVFQGLMRVFHRRCYVPLSWMAL